MRDPDRRLNLAGRVALALGVLLMVPSLWGGFLFDDYIYLLKIEARVPQWDPDQPLFEIVPADPAVKAAWLREGVLPWWAGEDVHFYFFRPLSAALLRLDHALFGRWAPGHHAHSLLWWALLLAGARLVLWRVLPRGAAVLALVLFALDESHLFPVAWVANRNALVAIAPVVLGLWAHLRWREERWRPGRVIALALYAVGLLGGEAALGAMAYPLAYEAFGAVEASRHHPHQPDQPDQPRQSHQPRRLRGLAPLILLGAAYAAVYTWLGCGVSGSGIYLDPLGQPLAFAGAAPATLATILAGSLAGVSADLWYSAPSLRGALALTGLAAAALFGLLLRASWPREDHRTRQHLTWLLVGSAGSLLPVAATFPSDRLALAASLGLAAALATILLAGLEALRRGGRRLVVAGAGLLSLAHLLLAPLYGLAIQAALIDVGRKSVEVAQRADLAPPPERFDAIVLSAPDHVVGIYAPLQLERDAAEVLRSWRPLSLAPHDHRVTRVDERTIDLEVIGGSMMTSLFERLYRSPDAPLAPGETLDRGLLRVRILAANAAGPTRVRFVFERSLDDPSLRLLVWRDGRLQRIAPPAIGASVTIAREPGPGG